MTVQPTPPSDRLRIIVLGYIVRGPLGGMAWHHLQYVLGLQELGHQVLFLEDSDDYPSCYDPTSHLVGTSPQYGLRFASTVFDKLGLSENWAYFDAHTSRWYGPCHDSAVSFCREADLVINVSGVNPLRDWVMSVPHRVFVDTDPVFTQIRHLTDPQAEQRARAHNAFFTFGERIASGESTAPVDGLPWQPTRQPVVLSAWPVTPGRPDARFTTVMQWESYPPCEFGGQRFGLKSESFQLIAELPQHMPNRLELALGSHAAPRSELQRQGWKVVDPLVPTRDPWTYQAYLQASAGELSVAKHGYVTSSSGWFSERSAGYLAAGRPVIVQDTGFSHFLPCGDGLHAFSDLHSAKQAVEQVLSDYRRQSHTAREIAAAYFDARTVLPWLLERAVAARVEVDR